MEVIFVHTQRTYWKWGVCMSASWQEVIVAHSVTDASTAIWVLCEAKNSGEKEERL